MKEKPKQKTMPVCYSQTLPKQIENRLSLNLKKQYNLWDETIKRQVQLYPEEILPLIKEIFQKEYTEDVEIEMLSTEYAVPDLDENSTNELHSIFTDLTVRVAKQDIYHIECQMNDEKEMVLRVIEYDLHISLNHGIRRNNKSGALELKFPKSVILYLEHTKNTPDFEICKLNFADGTTYQYRVPVMKVQNYEPKDIREKNLRILMPFLPIRFRDAMTKGTDMQMQNAKNRLTIMLSECMIIINQQHQNKLISEREMKDLIKLTENACRYLYGEVSEVMQEVQKIMEPFLKMDWEIIEEQKQQLKMDWEIIEEQKLQLKSSQDTIEKQNLKLKSSQDTIRQQKNQREKDIQNMIAILKQQGKSESDIQIMLESVFGLTPESARDKLEK